MRRPTTTWAFASTRSVRSAPLTLDDLPGAIESWTHALRLAPDSPDAHTNLASAYIMSKPPQADKALEHLTYVGRTHPSLAATQSPDDGEIHFNLGTVLEACTYDLLTGKMYRAPPALVLENLTMTSATKMPRTHQSGSS